MSWQLLVNDASRALAVWPQATAMDVAASLSVVGVAVAIIWAYAVAFRDVEAPSYARLEHEQGGVLFGKSVMRAGYWALQPVGRGLQHLNIQPSSITIAGLFCAAIAAVAIVYGMFGLAGCLLLAASLCDALDGMVARLGNESSESGAALDAIVDRLQEILVLSAFAFAGRRVSWVIALSIAALLACLMNSYVSAKAEVYRVQIPSGRMRRGERSTWIILGCLLVPLAQVLMLPTIRNLGVLPLILALLAVAVGTAVSAAVRAVALVTSLQTRSAIPEVQCERRPQTTSRGTDLRSLGNGIETWLIESAGLTLPVTVDAGKRESPGR